jgi:hypothetical protein
VLTRRENGDFVASMRLPVAHVGTGSGQSGD